MPVDDNAALWDCSLDAALMTAYDDGQSIAQLACALRRSEEQVWARLNAFGRVNLGDLPTTPIHSLLPRFEYPQDMQR
jgi:hypothetical protein